MFPAEGEVNKNIKLLPNAVDSNEILKNKTTFYDKEFLREEPKSFTDESFNKEKRLLYKCEGKLLHMQSLCKSC